jgi:hypothetical protein
MTSSVAFPSDRAAFARCAALVCSILLSFGTGALSQSTAPDKPPPARPQKKGTATRRISLAPKFTVGQTFRYEMEFETTTATSRSGIVSDPQGPFSSVVDWNATVRVEVLPANSAPPGRFRLRTTYEKSTASVHGDSFDPAAGETRMQFENLEGKVIEFVLDAGGNVKSVAGLEGLVDDQEAAQAARQWVDQFGGSAGAPPGGVIPGQTWSSEQPATSIPLSGLAWRSDAEYLRNEPCHAPNPELPAATGGGTPASAANAEVKEVCAVILTKLDLIRHKAVRDPTPGEFRKNGVQTAGKWTGSGQSLTYVSLRTGLIVSVTQTGAQEMDVTLTKSRARSLRYAGKITSRSQVSLVAGESTID